jgi:replicative DNA helicase
VIDFGLTREQSLGLMAEWNQSCRPPWSQKELEHKVDDADKQPGERNRLRNSMQQDWPSVRIPTRQQPMQPKIDGITLATSAESYLARLESGEGDLVELGIADLDYALGGGVASGEMVIVAARPSHGKSAVALQCLDTTSKAGMVGVMISEEMSKEAIGKRVIQFASEEAEEHWKHQIRSVRTDLFDHFSERAEVYVVEGCRTAEKAAASLRWYAKEHDAKIAVIDYAQILGSKGSSRYEEVTNTSITLRKVANETGMIVLVLCQLNRSIENRDKFIPRGSDLRETGQLEQDADVVFFLVWPHRIDSSQDPSIYKMYIAKNRNRAINQPVVEAKFLPSRQMVLPPSVRDMKNYVDAFEDYNQDSHTG